MPNDEESSQLIQTVLDLLQEVEGMPKEWGEGAEALHQFLLVEVGAMMSAANKKVVQQCIDLLQGMMASGQRKPADDESEVKEASPNPSTDAMHVAQKARAKQYGISMHADTHLTRPSPWQDLADSEFADPVNYKYPIHDKAHADNAAARLAQNKSDYDEKEYAIVSGRIEAAQRKFGEKVKESLNGMSYQDLSRKIEGELSAKYGVRNAWVAELYEDSVVYSLELGNEYFKASYSVSKEGKVSLGTPIKVERTTVYNAVTESASVTTVTPGDVIFLRESAKPDLDYEPILTIPLREVQGSNGPAFRCLVIAEGRSGNRRNYKANVLAKSAPLLEGRSIYVDHLGKGATERSLSDKAGWWSDPAMESVPIKGGGTKLALVATANLLENSGVAWLPKMMKEVIERGAPNQLGISIFAGGKGHIEKDATGPYLEVDSIEQYLSADAVAEAGAGGQPLRILESLQIKEGENPMADQPAPLTKEELETQHPDLVKLIKESAKAEAVAAMSTEIKEVADSVAQMKFETALSEALSTSKLPSVIQDKVRARLTTPVGRDTIEAVIKEYQELVEASLTPASLAQAGIQGFIIPSQVSMGVDPVERAQLALDHFFGAPIPEDKKGKFNPIRSFRRFYEDITGDDTVDGYYHPEKSILREALPGATHAVGGGTITMSNLLGTSLNRAVVKQYSDQVNQMWWRPFVNITELQNLKQQDRIRLKNFTSLTERTIGTVAEYTELDWGEVVETYSPVEYGNLVTVTRWAIINDDLQKVRMIPTLLARSARLTLNEFVSSLFTANSGNGPTLTDAVQVFNAASHQSNRGTTAFSRTALMTAYKAVLKMQDDVSKPLAIRPRFVLHPADLMGDVYGVLNSQLVADSANNERNAFSDPNGMPLSGIFVPNWSDTNNWYLMPDPAEITTIEIGFLFGREVPELFSQTDPSSGMVFTHDTIAYKVRWNFGGDWVDYRGCYANIVA